MKTWPEIGILDYIEAGELQERWEAKGEYFDDTDIDWSMFEEEGIYSELLRIGELIDDLD